MSTVRVVISLVSLVIILVVVQSATLRLQQKQSETLGTDDKSKVRQEVQSSQTTPSPTINVSTAPTTIKPKYSPTPSTDQQTTAALVTAFIYPNATITEQDDTHVKFQTHDPVNTVFQWYEDKIDEFAGRSKSVVKTEVNNDFLAKLRAVIKNGLARIEIRKKAEEKIVFIEISISPS